MLISNPQVERKKSKTEHLLEPFCYLILEAFVSQLGLQEGKKTATAPELEFGDIKTANKKVKHIAIDSRFCDVCQQVTVEDMIKCMPCRKWVHENFTEVKKGEKSAPFAFHVCDRCSLALS
jgi:hypothetical protein